MGSDRGRADERPAHYVEVVAFDLARTPVTRAQYAPFVAAGHAAPPPWWDDPAFADASQPVVGVTWFEAMAFAEWLGRLSSEVFRLPTEAEWERAARGGLEGAATSWGERLPDAEVPTGPLAAPWPVGRGTPNGFDLLDMGTIVHEWCLDRYRSDAYSVTRADCVRSCVGQEGAESSGRRSSRGGSWRHHVRWSSPAARSSLPPGFRYSDYGFRLLREI